MTENIDIKEVVRSKIKDLPPLPVVVQQLVRTLEDESSSADDVMKVLSSDQALASKVLKLVNSSFYGLSGEVSTPSRAVVILGFAAIRNLALGLSVAKFLSMGAKDHQQEFWNHAITVAAACQVLAKRTGYPDAEEAFIAGLLHDIGQMVLGVAVPRTYPEVLAGGPADLLANEERLVGLNHARAGQMLLKHWKLPQSLTNAARFHHKADVYCKKDDPLVSLVALADAVSNVYGSVQEATITAEEFTGLIEATGFDVTTTGDMLRDLEIRVEETKVFLQIATDSEAEDTTAPVPVAKRMVMICTDKVKMVWTRAVLEYFGVELASMKDFFANPGDDDAIGAVILDPGSVSAEQLTKMKPRLVATSVPILVLDSEDADAAKAGLGMTLPTLPLAFSRSDLTPESVTSPVGAPA